MVTRAGTRRRANGGLSMSDNSEEEDVVCVDCGSDDCEPPTRGKHGFHFVNGAARGNFETMMSPRYFRCNDCGYVWRS